MQKLNLVDKYTAVHLFTKFEEFILIYAATIVQNWLWSTVGYKVYHSDPIVIKLNSTCRAAYCMYIFKLVSNWYLKACWNKSG